MIWDFSIKTTMKITTEKLIIIIYKQKIRGKFVKDSS
jgi:hypothetical protein